MRRIGVAVGELSMKMAHPLATISAENNLQRFTEIAALVDEWKPVLLVVGLPAHEDGAEREFAALGGSEVVLHEGVLKAPLGVPCKFVKVALKNLLRRHLVQ